MILLPYDGSADARAAITRVAHAMPGATVTVLTVWEPFMQTMARNSMGMSAGGGYAAVDCESVDEDLRAAARETAGEGVQRATDAGLFAVPRIESRHGDVATTILGVADDLDTDIIALGTRGRGGMKAFLLGSVSHAVVQHADRAVLLVPARALAEHRREQLGHHAVHSSVG